MPATQVTLAYTMELEGATLEIYDLTGRNITKKALSSSAKELTLAVDSLSYRYVYASCKTLILSYGKAS